MAGGGFISLDQKITGWRLRLGSWRRENAMKSKPLAIHGCCRRLRDCGELDGEGKATPYGERMWLVGFGFLAICSNRRMAVEAISSRNSELPRPPSITVDLGNFGHARLGASRPDRRQPVKAGAFRARCAASALTGCRRPGSLPSDRGSKRSGRAKRIAPRAATSLSRPTSSPAHPPRTTAGPSSSG